MTKLFCENGWTTIRTTGLKSNLCFNEDKAKIEGKWVEMKRWEFLKLAKENWFTIKLD